MASGTTVRDAGKQTLVLGGARSGKSEVAERMVAGHRVGGTASGVTYVATGDLVADPEDPGWQARIEAHRQRRPAIWDTVELHDPAKLAGVLLDAAGTVLVDALGTWIVALPGFGAEAEADVVALLEALRIRRGDGRTTVLVSDEVGLGVHPPTEVGSRFRDALGTLNRRVAGVADEVLLVVAGRILRLEES